MKSVFEKPAAINLLANENEEPSENQKDTILKMDENKIKEIQKKENEKKIKEMAIFYIDSVIEHYEKSEQKEENLQLLVDEMALLLNPQDYDRNYIKNIDRAWNEQQVEKLLNIYTKNQFGENESMLFLDFWNMLHTRIKKDIMEDQNTVGDLVAKNIISRISKGEKLDINLAFGISRWMENLSWINRKLRIDLISTILNNPGQVDRNLLQAIFSEQSLQSSFFSKELIEEYEESKNDPSRVLKIIDVLEGMKKWSWENGIEFDIVKKNVERAFQKITDDNKNYFINFRLNLIREIDRKKTRKILEKYEEESMRNFGVVPLERSGQYKQKQFELDCAYSQISEKYAVIYNPIDGNVDSFFEIGKEYSRNLRIEDIIKNDAQEFYQNLSSDEQSMILNNYKNLISIYFREKIEKEFGIKFNSFNIREQIQFVNFLSNKKIEEIKIVINFFNNGIDKIDRTNRAKSFLALELDKSIGEKIIKLGDVFTPRDANIVFAKIAELSDFASKEKKEIEGLFYTKNQNAGISGLRLKLLEKAQDIIVKFADVLKKEVNQQEEIEKLLADLNKTKIEIELLHSVLKSAKENRENINFEIIRDLKIETKEIGEDLSEEEKAQIKKIAIENYSEIYKNAPEELKAVLEELDAELNSEKITGQRKYILKYKEQLIAFCRFKPIEGSQTDVYGGSFHVYRDLQNLCIGKYFVEKAIDKESEKYNIRAICRTELFEQLYQKMGFEKQDEIEENGVKYYNIILPKKETSQEK